MSYEAFIANKTRTVGSHGFEPAWLSEAMFPFQRTLTEWAIRRGRAALFADTGLGKTLMQLAWAQNVVIETNKPVLILTPLCVAPQTVREGAKFGIECAQSRDGSLPSKIVVTNYQQLHKFRWQDFGGVVGDESGCIKNFSGATTQAITEFMRGIPYRLLATATAAPNDFIELGTSSEALGELRRVEMLATYFSHDGGDTQKWGLKGHAQRKFWQWVCGWARALRKPSDAGFSNAGYDLPPLVTREHTVNASAPRAGFLFDLPAIGLKEQREDRRRTINQRCEMAAALALAHPVSLLWCHLNQEGDLLQRLVPGSRQISGADSDEEKEETIAWFLDAPGERRLISKPSILSFGLNLQCCAHMTFFPSHSFEQWYQAVRRCWRYGQTKPVHVDIITSDSEAGVLSNMKRKSEQADEMFSQLVSLINSEIHHIERPQHIKPILLPSWL